MSDMLRTIDQEIFQLLNQEAERQETTIDLIASENFVHPAIKHALASSLTNKYAEGYPGKRYYAGCTVVDQVELLAQERVKKLFSAEHVNVQPHAGSQANMAVFTACLKPGDTILGMSLSSGGHLTHGHKVNFSGTIYHSVQYGVNRENELIDYEEVQRLADLHKPRLIIAGGSSYCRVIDFRKFREIANSVGAYLLADCAHVAGLIAAKIYPNPFPQADFVTFTTHKTLRGPRGGVIMCKKEYAAQVDKAVMPGIQGGPFMHAIAAKAVAFKLALQDEFKDYQQQVVKNAQVMAQDFARRGYRIVSEYTETHLFVVDLSNKNIDGKTAEQLLERIGIITSRSCIPNDPLPPSMTSGLRIGAPAITTKGADESMSIEIVRIIDDAIEHRHDMTKLSMLVHQVEMLTRTLSKNSKPTNWIADQPSATL